MPEFDVVVLVPVKLRVSAKNPSDACANAPRIAASLVGIHHTVMGATIPLSVMPVAPAEWDESRIDIIGQNGNDGEHY